MRSQPRTYNNCNTSKRTASTYTQQLGYTVSSCGACSNEDCCETNAAAITDISNHLVVVDSSINILFNTGNLSNILALIEDVSQNVLDNSQSIIELNSEVDDLSGVVQDISASVHDLSGELYSLPTVVADLSNVVADLSSVVLDLSGDFNTHLTAFTNLSGVVADLSTVVLDLSGDFNTHLTAFTNLSGVVADLSTVVLDLSGDFNTHLTDFADMSGVVLDLSTVVLDLSGDFNTHLTSFTELSSVVADLSGVVLDLSGDFNTHLTSFVDLSSVVLDLSGDFNTLNPAFVDLSGVVADLSSVVLDLSGDFNTLNTAFVDLSGVVADLSSVVLDLSGDFNTLNPAFVDLSGVVADLSSVVLDLSGDFNTLSIAFTDLSGVVADLSGDFNTLSPAFTDLSGVVADVSNSKVDKAGDTITGNLVLDAKLVLSTDANDVFITKTGTGNKSLLLQAGDDNSSTDDFAIQFNVRNATGIAYNSLYIDGKNNNIQANREVIVYNQNYATSSVKTFINTGDSNTYPFIATGNNAVGGAAASVTDVAYGFGMMYKTDGNMDIVRYFGTAGAPAAVMNFNRDNGNTRVKHNLFIDGYVGVSGEGILFDSSSPASTSNRLYRNGADLYWDNDRLSVWDESGTSLVLDLSYDNIIIPGSTTKLGVDHTNKIAYFETDLSNIKFNVQGNNAITIDNSSIDLSGTVNFSDTLSAKQGLNISTYTPGTTTQTLYTPNGTDLYWNGTALGSTDVNIIITDLSTVVLDLSGDFNTLSTAFTDLSGVVTDLSTVVLDLSGDFNTLSTAFTDLSGNVTDISNNKVSKSGDTMTGNLTISKSTPQLLLTDTSSTNNSSINVDSNGLMLNVNSSEVLKLSGPNATGTNPFITVRNTFGNSSRMRFLNPNDVNDLFDIGIHNSTFGNERFIDHNGYQLGFYGSGTKVFNGGSVILNTDLSLNHGVTLNAAIAPASTTNKLYRVDSDVYWDGQKLSVWDTSGTSLVLDACYNELIIPGSTTKLGVDSGNNKAYLETDLSSIELNFPNNKVLKLDGTAIGSNPVMSLNNENASAINTVLRIYSPNDNTKYGNFSETNDGRTIIHSKSGKINLHAESPSANYDQKIHLDAINNNILFYGANGSQVAAFNTNETILNSTTVRLLDSSKLYLGSSTFGPTNETISAPLQISHYGGSNSYIYTHGRLIEGGVSTVAFGYFSASILTNNDIMSYGAVRGVSDIRIKKNIIDDVEGSLELLRKIEVKKYHYKDVIQKSTDQVRGFIAQQVKEIVPEAIKYSKEFIPSIMCNGQITLDGVLTSDNLFTLEGDTIKILDESDNIYVIKVISNNSTSTKSILIVEFTTDKKFEGECFIYGEYVTDLHTIDKNHIFTLTCAAVKELDIMNTQQKGEQDLLKLKVQTLEIENTTLKQKVADLETENADIKARLRRIEESLNLVTA